MKKKNQEIFQLNIVGGGTREEISAALLLIYKQISLGVPANEIDGGEFNDCTLRVEAFSKDATQSEILELEALRDKYLANAKRQQRMRDAKVDIRVMPSYWEQAARDITRQIKELAPDNDKRIKTFAQMLRKAQYSRIVVGNRWVTTGHPRFVVLEACRRTKKNPSGSIEILSTDSEEAAIRELIKGEELYKHLIW